MAVTFDALGPSSSGSTSSTSTGTVLSWTHTAVASGVAIVVGFAYGHSAGGVGTVAVTCDGNAMTQIGLIENDNQSPSTSGGSTSLWGIANQASGAHTIAITVTGGSTSSRSNIAGSVSYAGADTAAPFGTGLTAFGSSAAPAIVVNGTAASSMIAAVASCGTGNVTNPATSRWVNNLSPSNGAGNAGQVDTAGGSNTTLTWSSGNDWWGTVAVEVKAASGGASPVMTALMFRPVSRKFRARRIQGPWRPRMTPPPPPAPGITRDQKSTLAQVSSATSLATSWAANPQAGSTVLVFVQVASQPTSVVDNGTTPSTFTLDKGTLSGKGAWIYRANNITLPSAGSYSVTATVASAGTIQIAGISYLNVQPGAPTATNNGGTTGTAVSSGAASPANPGGLVFGGFSDASSLNPETITFTGSAPLTEEYRSTNGSSFWPFACADGLTGSSQTLTWTLGDSVAWGAAIAAYDFTAGSQAGAATLQGTGSVDTALATQQAGATLAADANLDTAFATQQAGATLAAGANLDTALATQRVPATLSGAGSLGDVAAQGSGGTLGGAGSVSTAVIQGAVASLSGAGSLGTTAVQGAGAALSGTGSVSAQGGPAGAATLGGAGSVTTAAGAGSGVGGQGSVTTGASLLAPASLAGTGSLSTSATVSAIATLVGAGSLTTAVTQRVIATLAGAGALSTAEIQGAGVSLGAAGSLSTAEIQGTIVTLGGAGSLGTLDITGAPATLGGQGSVTTAATISAVAALAGTGSLTGSTSQGSGLSGIGSIGPAATQLAPAVLAGAGSLTAAAIQAATATLAGAGSLTAAVTQAAGATLGGAGSVSGTTGQGANLGGAGSIGPAVTQLAPAVLSGTASLSTAATQLAPVTLTGTGSVTAAATQRAVATLAGAGSVGTLDITGAPAALGAAGSLTTPAVLAAPATLAAAGSITASVIQGVTASLAAAGSLSTAAVQGAGASLGGAGAITGSAVSGNQGAASLGGQGSLNAPAVTQLAPAQLSGTGSLTTAARLQAIAALGALGILSAPSVTVQGASLQAAGSVDASSSQHPPQVKGFSINWGVTEPMQGASSVGEAAGMASQVNGNAKNATVLAGATSISSVTQPQMSTSGVS